MKKVFFVLSLYTLAGFYILFLLQSFPLISIKIFHISRISLLSFYISIYHFHIFNHIFHPRLDRFSGSIFPMTSSGFLTLFLPISFQLSSLSVAHIVFSPFVIISTFAFITIADSAVLYVLERSYFSSLLDRSSASFFQFLYQVVSYFPSSVPFISLM